MRFQDIVPIASNGRRLVLLWRGVDALSNLARGTTTGGLHGVTGGGLSRVGPDPQPVHVVRGSVAVERRRRAPKRVSPTLAGARIKRKAPESSRGHRPPPALSLEPGQRRTLEMGSCLVLGGLGVGFQLGGWPAWTLLAGAGIYLFWVVLYAEITVQKSRRQAIWQSWKWHRQRRLRPDELGAGVTIDAAAS